MTDLQHELTAAQTRIHALEERVAGYQAALSGYRALVSWKSSTDGRGSPEQLAARRPPPRPAREAVCAARRLALLADVAALGWFRPAQIGATAHDTPTRDDLKALLRAGLVERRPRPDGARRRHPEYEYRISPAGREALKQGEA
jgi:hypothetical protein